MGATGDGNRSTAETHEVRASAFVEATPERVWEAVADTSRIVEWFVDRAEGVAIPGGRMVWHWETFGFSVPWTVLEAERGRKLALRVEMPGRGEVVQRFTTVAEGEGARVTVEEAGLQPDEPAGERVKSVELGWRMALGVLKLYVEQHFGRRCEDVFAMRQATFEFDALPPLYRSEEGLARWLTESGSIGVVGDPVSLVLQGGGTVTGKVLCVTEWEALVSWDEMEGLLTLKAFPGADGVRGLAIQAKSWSENPALIRAMADRFNAALGRLVEQVGPS